MKVIAFDALINSARIKAFHYDMFHGCQWSPMERLSRPFLGEPLNEPLTLLRNVYRIPSVFQDFNTLLLSEHVRAKLAALQNIAFLEVKFHKLIEYPYAAGDDSFYRSESIDDEIKLNPRLLYDRLPTNPALRDKAGRYFELVTPRHADLIARYPGAIEYPYALRTCPQSHVKLSRQIMTDYPILWCGPTLLRGDVFPLIEGDIDWDYFERSEIEM